MTIHIISFKNSLINIVSGKKKFENVYAGEHQTKAIFELFFFVNVQPPRAKKKKIRLRGRYGHANKQ